jgi:UPF0755 protein
MAGGPMSARHSAHRRQRFWLRRLVVLAGVIVLAVIGLGAWYWVEAHPFGKPGKAVEVVVHPDESESAVLGQLTKQGVIGSSMAFGLSDLIHGSQTVPAGEYSLHTNSSFASVRAAFDTGPNVTALQVLPGQTLSEVADSLTAVSPQFAGQFLKEAKTGAVSSTFQSAAGTSLEGLIGTGTYEILPGEQPKTLLTHMVGRFDKEAAKAGLTSSSAAADGLSEYQVAIVASIDLKEGYFQRYLGPVARVIYNRLADGMNLAMTSTVLYSFGQDGGPVTAKEEATTTPYNTYLHAGLTPTPICTPSEAALAAAVHPPAGTQLYFDLTTVQKGVMVFSTTFTGQVAAEAQAAANAKKTKP